MPADPPNLTIVDRSQQVEAALRYLAEHRVMVGIPSDQEQPHLGSAGGGTERRVPPGTVGNAALGYIHENGSPTRNIPPRPWLRPGVANSREKWLAYLQQALRLALDGRVSSVDKALHAAGLTAVSAVKNYVVAGIPPPLKPATIAARRRRSKGSSYRRQATGAADVTPLVDTAQMLNSISYVIRRIRGTG